MPLLILFRATTDSVMGPEWAKQNATPAHWVLLAVVMTTIMALSYGFAAAHRGAHRRRKALSGASFAGILTGDGDLNPLALFAERRQRHCA